MSVLFHRIWTARILFIYLIVSATSAQASLLLSEFSDWQLAADGFAELDYAYDTHPSFLETAGNYPITGPDTPSAATGRRQLSFRNSRIGFTLQPTGRNPWKPKAYVEFDLLGNRENLALSGTRDTYYENPSLRIRHLYLQAEHEGWRFLSGQYWTLFGWGPTYFVTTASVPPGPGVIYQRTQQFTVIKTLENETAQQLQIGLSIAHASQKAGGVPNLDGGIKYSFHGRTSGFASPTGEAKAEPLSLAISGTLRKFATGSTAALSEDMKRVNASAIAVGTMIPIWASLDGKDTANTLTWTAEWSKGTGDGSAFPGWSANLPQYPYWSGSRAVQDTYLGKGYGAFDSDGGFHLFRLESWNMQVQYHLPCVHSTFVTLGHSQLQAKNVSGLGPAPTDGFKSYDGVAMDFVNIFRDFNRHIRGAMEYARFTTHYTDGARESTERYQISAFYRF